jgi:hypothetical protein
VSDDGDAKRRAWATAALAFGIVAPIAYIAHRVIDHAGAGEVDPLSMLRQTHVAYVWRAATAAFWGGLAALVALAIGGDGRWVPRLRVVVRTVTVSVVAFAVLAWAFP